MEKYEDVIVPLLFLKKAPSLVNFGVELKAQQSVLIVARILPQHLSAASRPDPFIHAKYRELQEFVPEAQFRRVLDNGGLCRLIALVLTSAHDARVVQHLFGMEVVLPLPGSFHSDKQRVLEAIEHFQPYSSQPDTDGPFEFFVRHLKIRRWEVHGLLVELYAAYESGSRLTDKQQALMSLYVAADLLVSALSTNEATLLQYAFHSIVFRLGHILRNGQADATLRRGALVILKELLTKVIVPCPAMVAKLLVTIIGFVTPLAIKMSHSDQELSVLAMSILEFLLDEHQDKLKDVFVQLSPFPDVPQFARLNEILKEKRQAKDSLELYVETFLRLVDELDHSVPVESLQELTRMLGTRKQELSDIYAAPDSTLLHRLVCCLVRLTRNKSAAHLEALSGALGELGPAELTTLILQPDLHISDKETPLGKMEIYAQSHPSAQLPMTVFPLLIRYLISAESVQLLCTSGRVLLEALNHLEGHLFYELAKKYRWPSMHLLLPFRYSSTIPSRFSDFISFFFLLI